jgi:endonuclease/exonuclease/phosphatase family metal-dependent hydrolase
MRNRSTQLTYRQPPVLHRILKHYYLFFVLFAFIGCQNRSKTPPPFTGAIPDTVSVLEYNVENLFDMNDNGTEYPEYKPNTCNWTLSTFQTKLDNIASVIAAAQPDIAVLVEIENENALLALLEALKNKNRPFAYYACGDKPNRTITMPCILSRFPVLNSAGYGIPNSGENNSFRNVLEADIFLGRDTLKVFACHWPSKKEPESIRIKAAILLKEKLDRIPPLKDYIIAGDFNENYNECADFRTLGLDDTHGKTGINHVLGTVRSFRGAFADYVTRSNILAEKDMRHYDPWLDLPENRRMSEVFRHHDNTPDHILLPRSLFDSTGLSYADHSFRAFSWNGRLILDGAPYRWQMRFEDHRKFHKAEGYSDHLPVMLKIRKGPFHPDTLAQSNADNLPQFFGPGKTGGFESGVEGWAPCSPHITCARDTEHVRWGKYCLRISGQAGKQNVCAARAIIQCARQADSLENLLAVALRGQGTFSFRARAPENKKWTYFNWDRFGPAKAAKYAACNFIQWTTLKLSLAGQSARVKEIEFEIRVKKQTAIDLRIDNVNISGASLGVE